MTFFTYLLATYTAKNITTCIKNKYHSNQQITQKIHKETSNNCTDNVCSSILELVFLN